MPKSRARFISPENASQSGLYVFSDGPAGPTKVNMKSDSDVFPFAERLIDIGRQNVRVGTDGGSAIPYAEWRLANGPKTAVKRGRDRP